jgi:hypothetical protein
VSVGRGERAGNAQYRTKAIVATGVREYCEDYAVEFDESYGRPVVLAFNEGGYNSTAVDLLDLIDWLRKHRPELLR